MFVRSALVICLRPRTGSDCTPKAHDHQGFVSWRYVGYLLHFMALQASFPALTIQRSPLDDLAWQKSIQAGSCAWSPEASLVGSLSRQCLCNAHGGRLRGRAGRRADLLQGLLDVGRGDVEAVVRRQLVGVAPEVLVAHAPPLGRVGRACVDVQAAAQRSFSEREWHHSGPMSVGAIRLGAILGCRLCRQSVLVRRGAVCV